MVACVNLHKLSPKPLNESLNHHILGSSHSKSFCGAWQRPLPGPSWGPSWPKVPPPDLEHLKPNCALTRVGKRTIVEMCINHAPQILDSEQLSAYDTDVSAVFQHSFFAKSADGGNAHNIHSCHLAFSCTGPSLFSLRLLLRLFLVFSYACSAFFSSFFFCLLSLECAVQTLRSLTDFLS